MYQCYILLDGKFQVVSYEKDNKPDGFIKSTSSHLKYELVNGIILKFDPQRKSDPYNNRSSIISSSLEIFFRETILKRQQDLTPANIADLMNHYASMPQSDIENLAIEVQKQTRTELQNDIQKFQNEKAALEEKVKTLKKIIRKKDELNQLIKELD
ncbi:hypothetical protein [Carboxylicivirga sp. N1Y90]|uniref:hypothetical protein n=1 Tax=Carboxylicivirga fragile TaxID=3417571 RepID=UPI003D333553|nr:hypothetical protein [Marinilabiliaceae bacterium N1Y90]